jgi:hypothetical protein
VVRRGEKEAEADLREDLMDLADELMGRGWGDLEPEEQALVKELYSQHGLDLDQLLKQVGGGPHGTYLLHHISTSFTAAHAVIPHCCCHCCCLP